MNNLDFKVKNLGVIEEGGFTQKPLTIFCGPNNSGKTWAMYSLYNCHTMMPQFAEDEEWMRGGLSFFNGLVSKTLVSVLNAPTDSLKGAKFAIISPSGDGFRKLLRKEKKKGSFLIPAERNGLHLFYRELTAKRTALLHNASREGIDLNELLRNVMYSRYATPIADYIDWLNQLPEMQRGASGDFHPLAERVKRTLVRGAYRVAQSTGDITFKPYRSECNGEVTRAMGLHMTSSTVKSLFSLWFYLENQARKGDLLMIDEPELNIHPENQLKIARLLARLVNAGLNVVISTHSDYMVREFNNLLMLSGDKQGILKKEYKYDDEEILRPDQVGAYLFENRTITPLEMIPEDGIYAITFDRVIRELNRVNNGIYYDLQERHMELSDD